MSGLVEEFRRYLLVVAVLRRYFSPEDPITVYGVGENYRQYNANPPEGEQERFALRGGFINRNVRGYGVWVDGRQKSEIGRYEENHAADEG